MIKSQLDAPQLTNLLFLFMWMMLADGELTTNQDRARFSARDVRDYTEKAPAGLVIDSQTITKVLTAAEGTKPHTQGGRATVCRHRC